MGKIKVSSIVATAQNRAIGRDNDLPWHIPADFKHFKKTTMGKPMVMGRKCFESLGAPLPGRPHIVISRHAPPASPAPGVHYVRSIEDGLQAAKKIATEQELDEIFIIGGGEIYKQTLPVTDRLYLTLIHKDYEGDTFFPEFDWKDWKIISEEKHEGDPPFTFFRLERAQA